MLQLQDTPASRSASSGAVIAALERLAASRAFAYTSILLLQLKLVWGIWSFKDLTTGDTAHYFTSAWDWYHNLKTSFAWSPVYAAFYGSFLHISPDAYFATIAHRLVIVFGVAILVLYTMRRFLPPGVAWLMAAWWVLLPIDFDTKYEVHLFSVIPLLGAVLLARARSHWAAPASFAALLGTTLLMRNEYAIATALYAAVLLLTEYRRMRKESIYEKRKTGARYFVCVFTIVLIAGFFLLRSTDENLSHSESDKHALNICQVYAYGYQQRHSDFTASPWFNCEELMNRVFGAPRPGLLEAFNRNPGALLEHIRWNLSLIPAGIQLLLFNTIAGSTTPDYAAVPSHPASALTLSAIVLLTLALGAWLLYRDGELRRRVLTGPQLAWAVIGCMTVVAVIVMLTQRPRPSYLLTFGVFLRIAAGLGLSAILTRWVPSARSRAIVPAIAIALIAFVPTYYRQDPKGRPLLDAYRRLEAFAPQLGQPGTRFVSQLWSKDLCNYVGKGTSVCTPLRYAELRDTNASGGSLADKLQTNGASLFYADEEIINDPAVRGFFALARSNGWTRIGAGQQLQREWALYSRTISPIAQRDIVSPGSGITLGENWYAFERFAGASFRWVKNDAEIKLDSVPPHSSITIDIEPGPAAGGKVDLTVLDATNRMLAHAVVSKRQTVTVDASGNAAGAVLRLHSFNTGMPFGTDPRILNFRVFRIASDEAASSSLISQSVPGQSPTAPASPDIVSASEGLQLGQGWYPFEVFGGQQFRWVNNDAELNIGPGSGSVSLSLDIQPGPGAAGKTLHVQFLNRNGETKGAAEVSHMETIRVRLPLSPGSRSTYRIHIEGGGASTPGDPRILNLRVFHIRRVG